MTTTRQNSDPYGSALGAKDRGAYDEASGDVDLSDEIRLMRAMVAHHAGDLLGRHRELAAILALLIRAVTAQAKGPGSRSEIERLLEEAAQRVLRATEAEEPNDV